MRKNECSRTLLFTDALCERPSFPTTGSMTLFFNWYVPYSNLIHRVNTLKTRSFLGVCTRE